jgi:hypothetical protein
MRTIIRFWLVVSIEIEESGKPSPLGAGGRALHVHRACCAHPYAHCHNGLDEVSQGKELVFMLDAA